MTRQLHRWAWAGALALALLGCDGQGLLGGDLDTGDDVAATDHADALPDARQGYAGFGSYVGRESVTVFDPGTGPSDPPRVVRSFTFPDMAVYDAQMDADGFLWVATPDRALVGGILRYVYVVDPAQARVQRRITVPNDLRSVSALLVGPDRVFLRSQRNGFSGAIGAVDRRCAVDPDVCEATVLTDLGDVGGASSGGLRLSGETLYSFSNRNSQADRQSVDAIDTRTGEIVRSSSRTGMVAADATSFYIATYVDGEATAIRLDPATLAETGRGRLLNREFRIAMMDGRLYAANSRDPTLFIYDAATLEPAGEIDVSEIERLSAGYVTYALGRLAPGVLLLNHSSWLDTTTGTVHADVLPFVPDGRNSQSLRLPEGHPFAN